MNTRVFKIKNMHNGGIGISFARKHVRVWVASRQIVELYFSILAFQESTFCIGLLRAFPPFPLLCRGDMRGGPGARGKPSMIVRAINGETFPLTGESIQKEFAYLYISCLCIFPRGSSAAWCLARAFVARPATIRSRSTFGGCAYRGETLEQEVQLEIMEEDMIYLSFIKL